MPPYSATEAVDQPRVEGIPPAAAPQSLRFSAASLLHWTMLAAAAVLFVLHAFHLSADFPNHSPWMDWAKYTDEGWYGDAAIRHFQRGQWDVPGDIHPAVWPLLEAALFRFTGVTLSAARAFTVGIFALILLAVYVLLRRWQTLAS